MNKNKGIYFQAFCFVALLILFSLSIYSQSNPPTKNDTLGTWIAAGGFVTGLLGLIFGGYQYVMRKKNIRIETEEQYNAKETIQHRENGKRTQTYCQTYIDTLKNELNRIGLRGSEFDTQYLDLEESFVSLRLSHSWKCEHRFKKVDKQVYQVQHSPDDEILSPQEVMTRAFQSEQKRMLLIIGDPGSGKTTLLNYYAVTCLNNEQTQLGFNASHILPLYFPLREMKFPGGASDSLQHTLASWGALVNHPIPTDEFQQWLKNENTLVLLDGLDEIGHRDDRMAVCQWVRRAHDSFPKCRLVLTSRPTGIRKMDDVELDFDHVQADIMDFSPRQQADFLNLWFPAVYRKECSVGADLRQKEMEAKKGIEKAQAIIGFLSDEHNRSVRQLAAVPMLLQIMAILWKDRDYLPEGRVDLYNKALNYLLEFRDKRRNIKPLLPADKARLLLAPVALWMMETVGRDYVIKEALHEQIKRPLSQMSGAVDAAFVCYNLQERAGVIVDYGSDSYIFRHKSFLEFLTAEQLLKECRDNTDRMKRLVEVFDDEKWEEVLRFFMGMSDGVIFDRFMRALFGAAVSMSLDDHRQDLLDLLVREAPQRQIDGLKDVLLSNELVENQKRYILNCLKTIGSEDAVAVVTDFVAAEAGDKQNMDLARDIIAELSGEYNRQPQREESEAGDGEVPRSYRNPFEDNVEYIRIPDRSYEYSSDDDVTRRETVNGIYACKFQVTNKRYQGFVDYLAGKGDGSFAHLPLSFFQEKLTAYAGKTNGFLEYLGTDPREWSGKLVSRYDDNKRFNGLDQPVVGVNWYAARAYCFWMSCLFWEKKRREGKTGGDFDIEAVAGIYRLPLEHEWLWAAAGEPDGTLRKYPWATDKGEPGEHLANYGGKVEATTPVGRYPEGATPNGLMDMAGNVWEWMVNMYSPDNNLPALRGGSWGNPGDVLRCAARVDVYPGDWDYYVGFRVFFLPQSYH